MDNSGVVSAGDKVLVGTHLITVDELFASQLEPGDTVLGVASRGVLRRIPMRVAQVVDEGVGRALEAFHAMSSVAEEECRNFFDLSAQLLDNDQIFAAIKDANDRDVEEAQSRGRSVTRLRLTESMRADMVAAFRMWRDLETLAMQKVSSLQHSGWVVEEWRAPLGVIGFVFEGRPNVFADATGVLKSGNSVIFRIGSDALGTARAIMQHVIEPALQQSGMPAGAVVLIDSPEHAAGWALFSDTRLSLAVARGSGDAVEELGSIAQQSGISVSLHGTGGAWMILGEQASDARVVEYVQHSLDRKVCNTLNVVCVPRSRAKELCEVIASAADKAASARLTSARIHCVNGAEEFLSSPGSVDVIRANGTFSEPQYTTSTEDQLGTEFEWEESPEFFLVVVDDLQHAVSLFNEYSPQFVLSAVSDDEREIDEVWNLSNSPFFGDGFTRWVDGQFALLRPELGLSNWERGRLFARSGILSGDSAFTVRLRVRQAQPDLHR